MVAASAVRQHILTDLKQKFQTVDEAEDALGLSLEAYLDDSNLADRTTPSPAPLHGSQTLLDKLNHLTPVQLKELIVQSLQLLTKLDTPPTTLLEQVANALLENKRPLVMTQEDWQKHRNVTDCHICNKSLIKDIFLDSVSVHNPYTGIYCGQGHRRCQFAEMKKFASQPHEK